MKGSTDPLRRALPITGRCREPEFDASVLNLADSAKMVSVSSLDAKADLQRYLQLSREAMVWKLEGLGAYDLRRPLVPTGTNLLGLVKHVAGVEADYLGKTFGRPFDEPLPWMEEDAEPNADLWATLDESRDSVVALYRRVWAHSDQTIATRGLDAVGRVPWWPDEHSEVTLHRVMVHVIAENNRHAGHADILRELIDGSVGLRRDSDNLAPGDAQWWIAYRERLEEVARTAAGSDSQVLR